jgi:cell division protein FtsB
MPPARTAAAPRRQTRKSPPRRRRTAKSPIHRVRWDRVGRTSLLVVLAVVLGLYVKQAISYFSVRTQADQQMAVALRLERQNRALERQQQTLESPATIQRDARALGMVHQGERPYVITGVAGR